MNAEKIEQLRRRMEEAALFPPEDPRRHELLQDISTIEGPLEQEWLRILQENEQLRLELARVTPPPGLQERLLAIPRDLSQRPSRRRWRSRWLMAVAASIILLAGLIAIVVWNQQQARSKPARQFAAVLLVAHEGRPELQVRSADWQTIQTTLKDQVPYEITRPTLDADLQLVGAKVVLLNGHPVVYSRWRGAGKTYCVYQFCAPDFGMQRPLPHQTVTSTVKRGRDSQSVILWSEGHCDYALIVEPSGAAEERQGA